MKQTTRQILGRLSAQTCLRRTALAAPALVASLCIGIMTTGTASANMNENFRLSCNFTKLNNAGYSVDFVKAWIPERQTHVVQGNEVFYNSFHTPLQTTVSKRTDERLEWAYNHVAIDKHGQKYDARIIATYFFTNDKIAMRMEFKGYRGIENIWGSCTRSPITGQSGHSQASSGSNNNATGNSTIRPSAQYGGTQKLWQNSTPHSVKILPVDSSDWYEARHDSKTKLYMQRHINAVLIESEDADFADLHERLLTGKIRDMRIAMHATNDRERLHQSKYKFRRVDYFGGIDENNLSRIALFDEQLQSIRYENKAFLELAVMDHGSGEWWVTRLRITR